MAIDTGDLTPRVSGAASLGVEQIGLCGFGTDIRPFCHVHANSGVLHDPMYGSSGVFRFGPNGMELSNDGGLSFRKVVLDQQDAYDGGNEIDASLNGQSYQGILVREPSAPFANGFSWDDSLDPFVGQSIYGFAVSGTPAAGPATASLSRLTSRYLHIRGSGDKFDNTGSAFFLGFPDTQETPELAASGAFNVDIGQTLIHTIGNSWLSVIGGNYQRTIGTFAIFQTGSEILISAGTTLDFSSANDISAISTEGDTLLQPFNASGQLGYRFGPYEAWHVNPSTNGNSEGPLGDGFFPIPHSGQVLQMILENGGGGGTLQQAYDAGQRIVASNNGPVHIDADTTYGLRLDTSENDHPHMIVSGVSELVSLGQLTPGALWMQNSSAGVEAQLRGTSAPANHDEAAAQALGIDTLFYTSHSGVTSVRTASGVSQFFNISASAAIDEDGLIVPLSLQTSPSNFYHVTNTSGIQIFVPGAYKISYVSVLKKNTGNLTQEIDTELRVRDKWGQEFRLFGSNSSAVLRDSNNLNRNTANGQAYTDLNAGDSVVIYAQHAGSPPAGNEVVVDQRRSNVIMEWVGPLGAGSVIRQKV